MLLLHTLKDILSSKKVKLYQEEVRKRNYKSFDSFALVATISSFMVLLFGLTMSDTVTFNTEFLIIFAYSAFMLLISRCFLRKHQRYITFAFYVAITPLMAIAIMMGTFLDRTEPSITIMVFLCVLTIFILDKPLRVVGYITVVAIVYTVCCYIAKDYQLFIEDMIDLIVFYFLAVGVNCFSLHDRIDSVQNFMNFRNKSEMDLLTGIYNRGAGAEKTEALLSRNVYGAFVIIDIDYFKHINDNYGHTSGDEILQLVSSTIKNYFKDDDIVFRIGGDEFAVYVVGATDRNQCITCLNGLLNKIKKIRVRSMDNYTVSISIGCSIYADNSMTFDQLYKSSDESLYEAKKAGKGCCHIVE